MLDCMRSSRHSPMLPPNACAMTSAIRDTCDPATANRQPPTANRQPPTANRQPPTANRQPTTDN
ncbi:hypothetical protein, partial [Burkholderia pseudomallei]|uniref:hypothetical protein n=1 Tax=Burkholderia pseudomallei TaxID=28450 RepID=UPI001C829C2A